MSRRKGRRTWLQRHVNDPYVRQAQRAGYRSRAAYKLQELDDRDQLLRPGRVVVDLGAAPGGWTQVAAERVGSQGCVVAVDLLEMAPVAGATVIRGDFEDPTVLTQVLEVVGHRPVDLVLSDMAPHISGIRAVDQPRALRLAELALGLARKVLVPGGDLLIKVFEGSGVDELRRQLTAVFGRVITRKPQASRSASREIYWLARNYRG